MKKALTNNLGMKILAILIAFIGWLVIINYDDPTITKTISGIKVTMENEASISDAGKWYSVESGGTVSIVVRGKKSVVDGLSTSDFEAIADLSKYSITYAVPVEVSLIQNIDVDIVEGKTSTLMINLENYITKQFAVTATIKGSVAEGYYIGLSEISVNPNRIEVSGPESVISKIASVKCIVDVTDASSEFSTVCEPIAYDAAGNRVTSAYMEFGVNSISTSGTPLNMTTVPVKVEVTGEAASGYAITDVLCSEEEITVASADASYIKKLEEIILTVDDTDFEQDYTATLNIADYLPAGTKIVSDNRKADVTVKIEQLVEKTIDFKANDVKFYNLPNDVICNYDGDYNLKVVISGLSEVLNDITIEQLTPTIDVGNLRMGTQKAAISFEKIEGVSIISIPKLTVILEEKQVYTQPEDEGATQPVDNPINTGEQNENDSQDDGEQQDSVSQDDTSGDEN